MSIMCSEKRRTVPHVTEIFRLSLVFTPHQEAIIATGYSETARVKSAQEPGASVIIKKPYAIRQSGTVVRKGLHPHQGNKRSDPE